MEPETLRTNVVKLALIFQVKEDEDHLALAGLHHAQTLCLDNSSQINGFSVSNMKVCSGHFCRFLFSREGSCVHVEI